MTDPDYTPNDIGPPERSNGPDVEVDQEAEMERLQEMENDNIPL